MSADWPLVSIDDIKADIKGSIAIGPFGSRMKSDCYVDEGIPVIRGTNITGGPTFGGNFVYITKEKAKTLGASNVYQYDLVFPHRGSIGEVGIILDDEHFVLSSSLMKLTCDLERVNPKFIYYFFKSRLGKHELLKNASQVGTPGIGQPLTSLKSIELRLPSLDIQNHIEGMLTSLDKKIELNRQTNQTLEQMAQAIFKSWFVDFDPTRAKIAAKLNGQDPERAAMAAISGKTVAELEQLSPDTQQQLRTTASIFPDNLVDSELGEIPEGWQIFSLGDLLEFNPKRILKKGTVAPYLDMKNVPISGHLADEISLREMASGTKFINGDTLLARITPCLENGKTAYVDFLEKEHVAWGSTEYIVMRPKNGRPLSLGYIIARQDSFRKKAIQTMTGTSGRQRANAKALSEQTWIDYPVELLKKFDTVAGGYLETAKINGDQNRSLTELRDTLLPKLLSGELAISTDALINDG
jgi:type I restriction enzyme S subunit